MKKIALVVGGKQYTITLEEPFAEAVEAQLRETFEIGRDNEVKTLLQAYLSKQIECLEKEAAIEALLTKINSSVNI